MASGGGNVVKYVVKYGLGYIFKNNIRTFTKKILVHQPLLKEFQ